MYELKTRNVNDVRADVVWESKLTEFPWGTRDLGQKKTVSRDVSNIVLLTMNDLHFMPTQEQLKNWVFCATREVYNKLYKPFYELREIKKDKVVSSRLVLILANEVEGD